MSGSDYANSLAGCRVN